MKIFSLIIDSFKEYLPLFKLWAIFLLIGAIFRIVLLFVFTDQLSLNLVYSLLCGLRMDTIIFGLFGLLYIWFYSLNLVAIIRVVLTILFMIYLVIEVAAIGFMGEFFSRPNYLFIEHLNNYEEILLMIWGLYKAYLVVVLPLLILIAFVVYKFIKLNINKGSIKLRLLSLPLMIIVLFIATRSSLDSSTPNQGFYTFSKSNMHNEIANNSIFSIGYATYLLKEEKFYHYGDISNEEAIENVKRLSGIENNEMNLKRFQKSSFNKKKNIILVIVESFGHEHVGHLGGTPTTPNLDALTKKSLYFTNMYAVGTRTSWGVSSIMTSLYPIPSREYVKASKSQKDFYTVARTLKDQGYNTSFLYSGDADFDNMRGFLLSNGFDNVYGKEDFDSSKIKYTWGYSDEDLYEKAFETIDNFNGEPYFLTLLTMSSHEPFDYPKDKFTPYDDVPLESITNSVKYADYAIGKFMKKLEDKGMLENTVVAFIADHNSNSYGLGDVPINKYKIASLIVSDNFKHAQEYNKIASQIDFMPTVLDIAGISVNIPYMGTSVLQYQRDSAILIAQNKNFAYMTQNKFIVYTGKNKINTYDYRYNKIEDDNTKIKYGLSFIYGSKYLYENKVNYK